MLIKAVAQAIPTYVMSIFKLKNEICHSIQSSMFHFWWGHKQEGQKIYWVSSTTLCKSKEDGGLSFRNIEAFNHALLAKPFG